MMPSGTVGVPCTHVAFRLGVLSETTRIRSTAAVRVFLLYYCGKKMVIDHRGIEKTF